MSQMYTDSSYSSTHTYMYMYISTLWFLCVISREENSIIQSSHFIIVSACLRIKLYLAPCMQTPHSIYMHTVPLRWDNLEPPDDIQTSSTSLSGQAEATPPKKVLYTLLRLLAWDK